MTNHPLGRQLFPNVPPELPLMQFHSIFPYPITSERRPAPPQPVLPWEGVVGSEKVTPQPSLPQTQHDKRAQSLLTSPDLQKNHYILKGEIIAMSINAMQRNLAFYLYMEY